VRARRSGCRDRLAVRAIEANGNVVLDCFGPRSLLVWVCV